MLNKSKIVKEALKFAAKGQFDKAIAEYNKVIRETPNDAATHNAVGDLHLKRNETEEAIESFKRAAEILNKDGFTLKAIALYKKVLNLRSDQVDVLMLMGKLNAERGMLGSANEYYLAAAAYFSKQGNKAKAIDIYKILCDLNPDNLALAEKLADLYTAEGMDKEAVSKYIDLAEKSIGKGELREARDFLQRAAPNGSRRLDFIRNSAILDLKENRLPEAIKKFEEARSIDPSDKAVASLLAETMMRAGRYEDTADLLRELLETDPANNAYREQLIDVHVKSGDLSSAWHETSALVEGCMDRNELGKAEERLRLFLTQKPDSLEALRLLSDICKKSGRQGDADQAHKDMAAIYSRSGEADKALNIYRQLLENNPEDQEVKDLVAGMEAGDGSPEPVPPYMQEAPETAPPGFSPEAGAGFDREEPPSFEFGDEAPGTPDEGPGASAFDLAEPGDSGEGYEDRAEGPSIFDLDETESPFDMSGVSPRAEVSGEAPGLDLSETPDEYVPTGEAPGFDLSGGEGEEEAGGRAYELPETPEAPDEFPAFDLDEGVGPFDGIPGMEAGPAAQAPPAESMEDIEGLDIFGVEGREEPPAEAPPASPVDSGQVKIVYKAPVPDLADMESLARQTEETEAAFPPSFEDRLAEIEVYIKYGLTHKAREALSDMERADPSNAAVKYKLIDLYKTEGDVDGFVKTSLELADTLMQARQLDEAVQAVSKALVVSPDNNQLKIRLECLKELSGPRKAITETAAPAVAEPTGPVPEQAMPAGVEDTETVPHEAAGAVDDYAEMIEEAEFYAQQGLVDEARKVYLGILATDPDNEIILEKCRALSGGPMDSAGLASVAAEGAGELDMAGPVLDLQEPETSLEGLAQAPPAEDIEPLDLTAEPPRPEPNTSLDDELDAAFREMDMAFADEGPTELEAAPVPAPPEPPAPGPSSEPRPEPVMAAPKEVGEPEEAGFFDLAAELRDELDEEIEGFTPIVSETFEDKNLEAVFHEFKKGVEEQLGREDYETHYNLGIAYKEMGMLDEAVSEFMLASKDASRQLDCASMLGLCYMEKGDYDKAVGLFQKGLSVIGRAREEYMGLKYDMATAYELSGDEAMALEVIEALYNEDPGFRDVAGRLEELRGSAPAGGGDEAGAAPAGPGPAGQTEAEKTDKTPTPAKKSRVSYL